MNSAEPFYWVRKSEITRKLGELFVIWHLRVCLSAEEKKEEKKEESEESDEDMGFGLFD